MSAYRIVLISIDSHMDDQQTLSVYLSHTKQQNPRNKLNNNPGRKINTMCMLRNAGKLA